MKSLLFRIIGICIILPNIYLSGQEENAIIESPWSIVISYNPSIIGKYSNGYPNRKDNLYLLGGNLGIQYTKTNSITYTLDFGIRHKRKINALYMDLPAYLHEHLNYIHIAAGIEYLPFGIKSIIDPFIGASISSTYLRYNLFVPEFIPYYEETNNHLLLMGNIELGYYYLIWDKINLKASFTGGMLSGSNNFMNLQTIFGAKVGISYQL